MKAGDLLRVRRRSGTDGVSTQLPLPPNSGGRPVTVTACHARVQVPRSRLQTNTLSPLGRLRQHSPGGSRQPGHGPTSTATSGQKRATPPVPSVLGGYGRLPLALLWSNAAPPAPGANVSPSGPAASLTERRPGNAAVFKVPADRGGSGFCKEMSDWDTCASGDAPPPGRPALRAPTPHLALRHRSEPSGRELPRGLCSICTFTSSSLQLCGNTCDSWERAQHTAVRPHGPQRGPLKQFRKPICTIRSHRCRLAPKRGTRAAGELMLPLRYVTARSTQTRRDLSPHPTVLMEKHFNWSPFQKPHSRSRE